jgi:hypothetical protein
VKVEIEVETLKELADRNMTTIADNAKAIADLRESMDRSFSEQQTKMDQGFAELRKEISSNFKWMMGTFLTGFFFLLGLLGRVAGLY